jgi:glycosyltransferase involved in cell wall biosynthesis
MQEMDMRNDNIKLISYVPHGAVPDIRGFAPAIVAYNLAKNLKNITVSTICNKETYKKDYEIDQHIGPINRIKEGKIYRRLFRKITRCDPYPLHCRAADLVNRILPDVLHAHQLEFPVDDFLRSLKKKIPVIIHAHVTNKRFSIERGLAHKYIGVSEYVKGRLIENGYPEDRVEVVHNGVDTFLFSPASEEEKFSLKRAINIPEEAFVISFVGRMQEVKGFHIFLRVAEILLGKYPDLHILVVGSEHDDARREESYDLRTNLRRKLFANYDKRYREIPPMCHNGLTNIFKITDISFLPSLSEPQGMVMIESMASGCITVSSNVGGIKESITSGESGFLLDKPEDVDAGIQLLEELINHIERYGSMKINARKRAVSEFDWTISAGKLEQLCLAAAC